MKQEPLHPGAHRHSRSNGWSRHAAPLSFGAPVYPGAPDAHGDAGVLGNLSDTVNATYDRLDELHSLVHGIYRRTAPPLGRVPLPVTATGQVCPPLPPDSDWVFRAALVAAEGLVPTDSGAASFNGQSTEFLADLGRDLRKSGITLEHYTAMAAALSQGLCLLYNLPYPGADLTYRSAVEQGVPPGLTELLQTVELGVRIAALGAVDDEESGVPAAGDAEVLGVQRRSPRVTVVRFKASPPRTGWAGQFLEFRCPAEPGVWRSAASAIPPNLEGFVEFAFFHDSDRPVQVTAGEHWVVANPTGALEFPARSEEHPAPVLIIAMKAGLSPVRALLLDASTRSTVPPVHLYWQVDHRIDLHEYAGLLGLSDAFTWLTVTPVITEDPGTEDTDTEDSWFDDPERQRFRAYSDPDPGLRDSGRPVRVGSAARIAVGEGSHLAHWGSREPTVLVAGDPADPDGVRDAVDVLTRAGVPTERIVAEPR